MNKTRQQFKGQSLGGGQMDSMKGTLDHNSVTMANAAAAAKAKPAPVLSKTSHVVYVEVDERLELSNSSHFAQ